MSYNFYHRLILAPNTCMCQWENSQHNVRTDLLCIFKHSFVVTNLKQWNILRVDTRAILVWGKNKNKTEKPVQSATHQQDTLLSTTKHLMENKIFLQTCQIPVDIHSWVTILLSEWTSCGLWACEWQSLT